MYKNIYDCFKHWYRGGTIYFYSDPHFSDDEMKSIRGGNYLDDSAQVSSINKRIGKNDTIIILGDIGNKEFLKSIRGYKVLILGNHDKGATTYKGYADEVYEGPLMISSKILLTHEPVNFEYAFNIHGHDHSKTSFQDGDHLNVCAELINYTPIPIKEIINGGRLSKIPDTHGWSFPKKHK